MRVNTSFVCRYIKANSGIDTEVSYPYKARDGSCHFKSADVGATDTGESTIFAGHFRLPMITEVLVENV